MKTMYLLILIIFSVNCFAGWPPKPETEENKIENNNTNENTNINIQKQLLDLRVDLRNVNKYLNETNVNVEGSKATLISGDTTANNNGVNQELSIYNPASIIFYQAPLGSKTIGNTTVSLPGIGGGITYNSDSYRGSSWGVAVGVSYFWGGGDDDADLDYARHIQKIDFKIRTIKSCVIDLHPTALILDDPYLANECSKYTHYKEAVIRDHNAHCDSSHVSSHPDCHNLYPENKPKQEK